MFRSFILVAFAAVMLLPAPAAAATTPELSAAWGWSWGGSADTYQLGQLRLDATYDLSGVISIPVGHLNWGEFQYTWRNTTMTRQGAAFHEPLSDLGVHTFQLAGLRAIQPGPIQPFIMGGIGTTLFLPSESYVDVEGERYTLDSSWLLSFLIGVGAKVWLGEEEKVGLRVQLRTMPALYNSSTGIWFGSGGGGASISGNAIWQWDVTAGLSIKLGG